MKFQKRTLLVLLCLYGSVMITAIRCSSNDDPEPVDCNTVTIALTSSATNPSGCASTDGSLTVTASGGEAPYQYALNNGSFGNSNTFTGLGTGTYTVTAKDKNGCEHSEDVVIVSSASDLAFTVTRDESGCKTNNGAITISATGGSSSYEYQLNTGGFSTTNSFTGLGAATYTVTVKDSQGCISSQSVSLNTGINFNQHIKTIIDTNCAVSGCHVTGGDAPMSLQTYAGAKASATNIKNAVLNNVMPKGGPPLSQELKDLIACWVDDGAPEN